MNIISRYLPALFLASVLLWLPTTTKAQTEFLTPQPEIINPYDGWERRNERVLMIHDVFATNDATRAIATALRHEGLTVDNLGYNPLRAERENMLPAMVAQIYDRIRHYSEQSNETLHIVCHGFGCLIAHAFIVQHKPAQLGRVVMLLPPYHMGPLRGDHAFIQQALDSPELGIPNRLMLEKLLASPVDYDAVILSGDTIRHAQTSRASYALEGKPYADGEVQLPLLQQPLSYRILPTDQHLLLTDETATQSTAHFINHGTLP